MPYTTHGWWYGPGEPTQPGPPLIAKCGGTAICRACREQAGLEPLPVHAPTTPTEQRPARTSPAAELRKAAAKLRAELPAEIAMTPRIVFGDEVDAGGGQFLTALAWCSQHGDWDGNPAPEDPEHTACFACEIVDLHHEPLAELIRDLLTSREALAALLGLFAAMYERRLVDTPGSRYATDVARAVNGSRPEVKN